MGHPVVWGEGLWFPTHAPRAAHEQATLVVWGEGLWFPTHAPRAAHEQATLVWGVV